MSYLGVRSSQQPGPELHINCPACGAEGGPAVTYDQIDHWMLLHFIPMGRHRTSWVVCGGCGAALQSSVPIERLAGMSPDELAGKLAVAVPLAGKLLACVGIGLFLFPPVSIPSALIAWRLNRASPGWQFAGRVGVHLSSLWLVLILIFGKW